MKIIPKLVLLFFFGSVFSAGFSQQTSTKPYKIASIELSGNKKTKDQIILRELSFDVGRDYDSSHFKEFIITRSISNLKNLDLFNRIDIILKPYREILASNDSFIEVTAVVEVVERWYLWPIPFIEYADRNFNEWFENGMDFSRTNYGLYLFKYNAFGKNQTIKMHVIDGYNQALGIQYNVPWLWHNPHLGLDAKVGWKSNKEVWYGAKNNELQMFQNLDKRLMERWESMLMINFRPGLYNWHKPYVMFNRTKVDASVVQDSLNSNFLSNGVNQQLFQLGYVWFREKRNNKRMPTAGNYQKIDVCYQKYSGSSGVPVIAFESGGFKYLDAIGLNRISLAGYASGRLKPQKEAPYEYREALGYEQYIRGYERYVIDGSSYSMIKTELRFHVLQERYFFLPYMPVKNYKQMPVESFISVFADQAYVYNAFDNDENSFTNSHQIGYGVGLNTMFYLDKVLRFEYSVNKFGDTGFRIHFHQSI